MRRLLLCALLAVGAVLTAVSWPPAHTIVLARPGSEFPMMLLLNGVPVKLGVLTSTGTSVCNTSISGCTATATPFTVTGGSVLEAVCDAAGTITIGTTASTDYTNAAAGSPMPLGVSRWFVLRDSDVSIALDTTGGTVNCAVFVMR